MKKSFIFLLCIVFLVIITPSVCAEKYVLHGYLGNGCISEGDNLICFLPDGLEIVPLVEVSNKYDNPFELIPVAFANIPILESLVIYIQRGDIMRIDDCDEMIFEFPCSSVNKRTPLFTTFQENDREIVTILLQGDLVDVYAHINNYYLVLYNGLYGFINESDLRPNIVCETTYRRYNSLMQYTEFAFVPGFPDGTEKISEEEAIMIAIQYLINQYDETMEHLDCLDINILYNISHIYGTFGPTWQVSFSGAVDDMIPISYENDEETDGVPLISNTVSGHHLFYTVEVSVETGDVFFVLLGDNG